MHADARRLVATRALRGFADGVVSVVLASWLMSLGFSPLRVSAIVTGTLLGSAALTLAVGLYGHRFPRRRVLLGGCLLMAATGLGFAHVTTFWPLLVIAVAGTLNPSSGDVSLFLPTEQAALSQTSDSRNRTSLFAWYNLAGTFAGAFGALASGALQGYERSVFILYAAIALAIGAVYS